MWRPQALIHGTRACPFGFRSFQPEALNPCAAVHGQYETSVRIVMGLRQAQDTPQARRLRARREGFVAASPVDPAAMDPAAAMDLDFPSHVSGSNGGSPSLDAHNEGAAAELAGLTDFRVLRL